MDSFRPLQLLWTTKIHPFLTPYAPLMSTPEHVSQRLRQIRQQQKMTLRQVEIKSRGKWKAVVVGSYERGSRSLSVDKAFQLCEFYGVPISQLFTKSIDTRLPTTKIIDTRFENLDKSWSIDLRQLRAIYKSPDALNNSLYKFLEQIATKRDDWNGELLTIRRTDQETLALITERSISELRESLLLRSLLLNG